MSNLEERMSALEAEMAVIREEAAAARALASGADRDVAEYRAELRGHTRVLNALRETQLEHYAEHKADAAEIKEAVNQLAGTVNHIRDQHGAALAQITGMLTQLIDEDQGRSDGQPS